MRRLTDTEREAFEVLMHVRKEIGAMEPFLARVEEIAFAANDQWERMERDLPKFLLRESRTTSP